MRIFDTFGYSGDIVALEKRLSTLADEVDVFVIVEATRTPDGNRRALTLRDQWTRCAPFHRKIRYIVLDQEPPDVVDTATRIRFQYQGRMRGLLDIDDADWVLVGHLADPPVVESVRALRDLSHGEPQAVSIAENACQPTLARRGGSLRAHGVPVPPPRDEVRPAGVQAMPSPQLDPVIICPYVHDEDRLRAVAAFGLDTERGRHLPFYLWQDTALIGPERAFETCWNACPGRDVIIVHPDMRPLPHDDRNFWYDRLREAARALPDAGMLACDLLYPVRHPAGEWYVQCAGGRIEDGTVRHIGGFVDVAAGTGTAQAVRYDERFAEPRLVDWVTFGGVYIRREVIDMVGGFDAAYRWAYVMDVDYSLEARLRGTRLYQVPVNLLHEENGSTRNFLHDPERLEKIRHNQRYFHTKWDRWFARFDELRIQTQPSFTVGEEANRLAPILLAEARARGLDFEIAALARALTASEPIIMADVLRAYELVLGRCVDEAGQTWWEACLAQRSYTGVELVQALCASPEYAARRCA